MFMFPEVTQVPQLPPHLKLDIDPSFPLPAPFPTSTVSSVSFLLLLPLPSLSSPFLLLFLLVAFYI